MLAKAYQIKTQYRADPNHGILWTILFSCCFRLSYLSLLYDNLTISRWNLNALHTAHEFTLVVQNLSNEEIPKHGSTPTVIVAWTGATVGWIFRFRKIDSPECFWGWDFWFTSYYPKRDTSIISLPSGALGCFLVIEVQVACCTTYMLTALNKSKYISLLLDSYCQKKYNKMLQERRQ